MRFLILFFLSLLSIFHATSQEEMYTLKLVDSLPLHFHFATNEPLNLGEIKSSLQRLSTIREGKIIVNAYTDSVGTIDYNTELAEKRMQYALNLIHEKAPQVIPISPNNKNEGRENQPAIVDTLFRRADILIFENQLTIEFDKPYPLPINFDGNQFFLRQESKVTIDKIVTMLKKHPELIIQLHGHVSGHAGDYELSLNRTLSVKEHMVQQGIDGNRITCIGFDNKKKLFFEQPWENNPANRRVEIIFQLKDE